MLFRRSAPPTTAPECPAADPLDRVICGFSEADRFTVRDACQGVHIFGATGSGKTSGSGRHLALSYLRAGFGGIVLTAKPDELELWQDYARQTGRADDLLILGEGSRHRFDILGYECVHDHDGLGLSRNLTALFMTLHDLAGKGHGGASSDNDRFWRESVEKLIFHSITLLRLSGERVSFRNIAQIIRDAPMSENAYDAQSWQADSFLFQCGAKASVRQIKKEITAHESDDLNETLYYWRFEFPRIPVKTRGNILETYSGMVAALSTGMLRELLTKESTLTPDDTFAGKIIVLNLPIKRFYESGLYSQVIFKYCWQRAVERRKIDLLSRPVFLWADEAQHFVNEQDVMFLTTARSSRACAVFLTQNLANYYLRFGGSKSSEALTSSLLGNLITKIFHSNTCAITNRYASDLFAKDWVRAESRGLSQSEGKLTTNQNEKPDLQDTILPREFSGMMTGGAEHGFMVEGIVNRGGQRFKLTGTNALRVLFPQR